MVDPVLGCLATVWFRALAGWIAAALLSACAGSAVSSTDTAADPARRLFVATLDGSVHVVPLDPQGDPGAAIASARVDDRLRFLAVHPVDPVLYALGDRCLYALGWRADPPGLDVLGSAEVGVRGTHVEIDRSGRFAIVASYGDHAVAMLPLGEGGVPGAAVATLGGGDDPTFRNAHQVRVHPGNRAVHVPCLGSDHIATLAFEPEHAMLRLLGTATTHDDAGPRHMDYHPSSGIAYVLNERASSITLLRVDPGAGLLTPIDTVSTMPEGSDGASRSSDIHVTPDGRHLIAVNREPLDDVVSFEIGADGGLREVCRLPTGGHHARTFAVDPTGARLWIGNTKSREITTFSIGIDGTLAQRAASWTADAEIYCVLVCPAWW